MTTATDTFVTWRTFTTTLASVVLTTLTLAAGACAWAWSVHIDQPHRGAVESGEYTRDAAQLNQRLTRIEDKLDEVLRRSGP